MCLLVSQGFPDRPGWSNRLDLFDRLGWPDFFGDHFLLLDAEPFINPAAHVLDQVGQALHW